MSCGRSQNLQFYFLPAPIHDVIIMLVLVAMMAMAWRGLALIVTALALLSASDWTWA